MSGRSYLVGIEGALHGAGLPYGYTITLWSSGAMLIHSHGSPGPGQIFLFAAGAAVAYGLLRLVTKDVSGAQGQQLSASPHLLRAGAIHVASIGLAVGAAALVSLISSGAAWLLGPLAATLVYLTGAGVELGIQDTREQNG